jgi:iron complex outermembrane recepter protein
MLDHANSQLTTPQLTGDNSVHTGFSPRITNSPLYRRTPRGAAVALTVLAYCNGAHAQNESDSSGSTPAEVVVTAQKKAEFLQDVPIPVTVLSADALTTNNEVLLRDYFTSVPGLNVSPNITATQMISIRGITTGGFTNPTVGILVDDVPFGNSTGEGNTVPDIDPGDLARIEVLRGPQGTLYGADSMGGLVKFVTADPSVEGYSGRLEAGTTSVHHGAQPGYSLRGSANTPITDTLAFRFSGFERQDPGYINNPFLSLKGVNESQAYGGHFAALWKPGDMFSLKLSALYQNYKINGASEVDVGPGLGDLESNYVPNAGRLNRTIQAYSATAGLKLGIFDLTSVTGYNINRYVDSVDYTYYFADYTIKAFPVAGTPVLDSNDIRKFTQEFRLSAPVGDHLDWLLGGFFTHETETVYDNFLAVDTVSGQVYGTFLNSSFPRTFSEYAAFTDLTVRVTDSFDIQIGARESHIKQKNDIATEIGPYDELILGVSSPHYIPRVDIDANAFTYLFTPRYRITPDLMAYVRLASGYRPGTPNTAAGAPAQSNPDKTKNYELGVKADLLDHKASIDLSLYYIDWKDIQIPLRTALGNAYTSNGSAAKSEGIELSVTARPMHGLNVSTWLSYNHAVLTEAFPAGSTVYGVSGDRLPNTAKFSGNLNIRQEFPISGELTGFVGGTLSYVGDRLSIFQATPERERFPGYAQTDIRGGTQYGSWQTNLFINNVTDKRGLLNGGAGYYLPFAYVYTQPRTVGLSVTKTF